MLRVGAVSYLNTKPLIHQFQRFLPQANLTLDVPSRLATSLALGELDIALIPSVEFLRGQDYTLVSNACIACHSYVRSVRLLFRVPPAEVKTLALDEGSRTSAAMAQTLLHDAFAIRPQISELPLSMPLSAVRTDALLVIGDRAMKMNCDDYVDHWDLGQTWNMLTGLPFIFAAWVANEKTLSHATLSEISEQLEACREHGLASLEEIVHAEACKHQLSYSDCMTYFQEQLHFYLGDQEFAGLDCFRQRAQRVGLITKRENSEIKRLATT